ncbi:MAG: STAS domain-containing protein [Candidatus Zixiibacteriota bacterium]
MELTHFEKEGVLVLEPKGKIMGGPDATVLHEKLHDLIEQGKKKVVIDLAAVDWMNSTGLGILISGVTTLRNDNGEMKLSNVNAKIKSLLEITKLLGVFDIHGTVDEAIDAF